MIKIAGIEFDNHSYDEVADVLYLSVGEPQVPAETDATPRATRSTSMPPATSSAW